MRSPLLLLVALALPLQAEGQIPALTNIFSKVQNVNTTGGPEWLLNDRDLARNTLRTMTFEVTITVASGGCINRGKDAERERACAKRHKADSLSQYEERQCELTGKAPAKGTCTQRGWARSQKLVTRKFQYHQGDSTVTEEYTALNPSRLTTASLWRAEIGLGYSRISGFERTATGLTFKGSIDELPALAVYFSLLPDNPWSPYAGVRGGLANLSAHAYTGTGDSVFAASGKTFFAGGSIGMSTRLLEGLQLLVEYDVTYREFFDISYGSVNVVPTELPRRLLASTHELSLGLQLRVH